MTCEVLVMNRVGAALAADSAVTLTRDRGDGRVYSMSQIGAEKIFALDEAGPIAVAIYGNAEFCWTPWKSAFDVFRTRPGAPYASVRDCAVALAAMLAETKAGGPLPVPELVEPMALSLYLDTAVEDFAMLLDEAERSDPSADRPTRIKAALDALDARARTYDEADGRSGPRDLVGGVTPRLRALLEEHYAALLSASVQARFGKSLGADALGRLGSTVIAGMFTDWIPDSAQRFCSGLVITGFGRADVTPALAHLRVLGAFGGLLKFQLEKVARTGADEPVLVSAFAQADPVRAFVDGVHPDYEADARGLLAMQLMDGLEPLLDKVDRAKISEQALIEHLIDLILTRPEAALNDARALHNHRVSSNLAPMLDASSAEGLAEHAKRLLGLAITQNELTANRTVAKPIAVVALSKGAWQAPVVHREV